MIVPGSGLRVVVATRPVDFRKQHDGLAAIVANELGLDPYSGIAVVFRPKRLDRIKVLWWDGAGDGPQASRAGALCLANDSRRHDAPVARAVRGAVRRSRLAPGLEPAGSQTACGGMTPAAS